MVWGNNRTENNYFNFKHKPYMMKEGDWKGQSSQASVFLPTLNLLPFLPLAIQSHTSNNNLQRTLLAL